MENTVNYNLKKPSQDDFYNVADFNSNADIIDGALKNHDEQISQKISKAGDTMTGRLNFDNANGGIQSANNQSRNFIAGGSALSIYNGSYITTEGVDFGGVGQGGNINFALPADKGLVLGVANVGSQVRVLMSSASPEGVKTAEAGSLCIRVDTGKIYVKQSGSGNVGWKELSVSDAPVETVITSGFASGWSGEIRLGKTQEGIKYIHIVSLAKTSDISTGGDIPYTIPIGHRPIKTVSENLVGYSSSGLFKAGSSIQVRVQSDGVLALTSTGSVTADVRSIVGAILTFI